MYILQVLRPIPSVGRKYRRRLAKSACHASERGELAQGQSPSRQEVLWLLAVAASDDEGVDKKQLEASTSRQEGKDDVPLPKRTTAVGER